MAQLAELFHKYIHQDILIHTRTSYALPLCLANCLWGCLIFRKETAHRKTPFPWVVSFMGGFLFHAFCGGIIADLMIFGKAPGIFKNDLALSVYTACWILVNYCGDRVRKFLLHEPHYLVVEALMVMDWGTASLVNLETISNTSDGSLAPFFWYTVLWVYGPGVVQYLTKVYLYGNKNAKLAIGMGQYFVTIQQIVYFGMSIHPCSTVGSKAACHESRMTTYLTMSWAVFFSCLYLSNNSYQSWRMSKKGGKSLKTEREPSATEMRARSKSREGGARRRAGSKGKRS